MKIDIEVPRKYVRTIWIIVSGLFRIAKGIFKRYSPFLFAMMKRRNFLRPIRDTLASIEDMNRKLRDSGNDVQSLKTGLISELRSSVKHSSNINFAVLLRGRPSIPVHGFLVLEFIKFYTYESILNLINSTRMVTIFPTKAHDGTESCIEYLEKRSTMHPHFYQKFAFV